MKPSGPGDDDGKEGDAGLTARIAAVDTTVTNDLYALTPQGRPAFVLLAVQYRRRCIVSTFLIAAAAAVAAARTCRHRRLQQSSIASPTSSSSS